MSVHVSPRSPHGLAFRSGDPGLDRAHNLLPRLTIAVVHGGDKENPGAVIHRATNARSWKSYAAVAEDIAAALRRLGVGRVLVLPDDMRLAQRLAAEDVQLVWLNSGGVQGYNPCCHTPALLEMLGLPYVGHNPLNASTLDNKHAFKRELQGHGLPTAPFFVWSHARGRLMPPINRRFDRVFADHNGRFVVKPVTGRASLHVHVVDFAELADAVETVSVETGNLVLIEPFLPGREFCVAVAGRARAQGRRPERLATPFVFSAIERHLDADEPIFTSMDVRPITGDRWSLVEDQALLEELALIARDVYLDFNLETLVRLDLRRDAEGRMMILEANPKPDLKRGSCLVESGLPGLGMDYDDLILALLVDRIDFLLAHRPGAAGALPALVDG